MVTLGGMLATAALLLIRVIVGPPAGETPLAQTSALKLVPPFRGTGLSSTNWPSVGMTREGAGVGGASASHASPMRWLSKVPPPLPGTAIKTLPLTPTKSTEGMMEVATVWLALVAPTGTLTPPVGKTVAMK